MTVQLTESVGLTSSGARVTLLAGPVALDTPPGVERVDEIGVEVELTLFEPAEIE